MLREDELLFDGIDGLAKAIVLQACNDYIKLKRKGGFKGVNNRPALDELLQFFHGQWYGLLTNIPAEMLLKQLDKIA